MLIQLQYRLELRAIVTLRAAILRLPELAPGVEAVFVRGIKFVRTSFLLFRPVHSLDAIHLGAADHLGEVRRRPETQPWASSHPTLQPGPRHFLRLPKGDCSLHGRLPSNHEQQNYLICSLSTHHATITLIIEVPDQDRPLCKYRLPSEWNTSVNQTRADSNINKSNLCFWGSSQSVTSYVAVSQSRKSLVLPSWVC